MARFVYRRMKTSEFLSALAELDLTIKEFCTRFQTDATFIDYVGPDAGHVRHWVVVALALLERKDAYRAEPAELRDCLWVWSIDRFTLARLLGINPTTVGRWLNGTARKPDYLPMLLGLMRLPGAMGAVRKLTAEWIVSDLKEPEKGEFPFSR